MSDLSQEQVPIDAAVVDIKKDGQISKPKRVVFFFDDAAQIGKASPIEAVFGRVLQGGLNVRAFASDGPDGVLGKTYTVRDEAGVPLSPQPAHGVTCFDISGTDPEMATMSAVFKSGADLVLVSCPGDALKLLAKTETRGDFSASSIMMRSAAKITFVYVVSPFAKSQSKIDRGHKLYPLAEEVVFLNEAFGNADPESTDFLEWYGDGSVDLMPSDSNVRLTALGKRAGVMAFPALPTTLAVLMDKYRLRVEDESGLEDGRLMTKDVKIIRRWRRLVAKRMEPIDYLFGISKLAPAETMPQFVSRETDELLLWINSFWKGMHVPVDSRNGLKIKPETSDEKLDFITKVLDVFVSKKIATPPELLARNPYQDFYEFWKFMTLIRDAEVEKAYNLGLAIGVVSPKDGTFVRPPLADAETVAAYRDSKTVALESTAIAVSTSVTSEEVSSAHRGRGLGSRLIRRGRGYGSVRRQV